MVILYVETNFLMAIAKGQDLEAENLLCSLPPSLRIVIPDFCYIEALNRWKTEKYYVQEVEKNIDKQINNSKRDLTSSNAPIFLAHLEQARIWNQLLLNDIQLRLFNGIDMLLQKAEVINLNDTIIRNISQAVITQPETLLIKQDIMDNLILQCILSHANLYPRENKVFLSGNSKDFGKPEVRDILHNSGIIKYFTNTKDFLSWLKSQST